MLMEQNFCKANENCHWRSWTKGSKFSVLLEMFNKNSMLFSTEIGNPLRGEIFAWGGGGIPGPPPLSVKPCIE